MLPGIPVKESISLYLPMINTNVWTSIEVLYFIKPLPHLRCLSTTNLLHKEVKSTSAGADDAEASIASCTGPTEDKDVLVNAGTDNDTDEAGAAGCTGPTEDEDDPLGARAVDAEAGVMGCPGPTEDEDGSMIADADADTDTEEAIAEGCAILADDDAFGF